MGFVRSGIITEEEEQQIEDLTDCICADAWLTEPFIYQLGFRGSKGAVSLLLERMLERAGADTASGRMYTEVLTNWCGALTQDFERLAQDAPAHFISEGRFFTGAMWVLSEDHQFEAEFEAFFQELLGLVPELEGCVAIGADCVSDLEEGQSFAGYLIYCCSEAGERRISRGGIRIYDPSNPSHGLSEEEIAAQFPQKLGHPGAWFDTLLDGVKGELTGDSPTLDACLIRIRDKLRAG